MIRSRLRPALMFGAAAGATGFHAAGARRFDLRRRYGHRFRARYQYWTRREPHGGFGARAEQESRQALASVRTDDDQVGFQVRSELSYFFGDGVEAQVRHHAIESLGRIAGDEARQRLIGVLPKAGARLVE